MIFHRLQCGLPDTPPMLPDIPEKYTKIERHKDANPQSLKKNDLHATIFMVFFFFKS